MAGGGFTMDTCTDEYLPVIRVCYLCSIASGSHRRLEFGNTYVNN